MKFNSMMMTLLLFATLAGCASIDLNTEGDGSGSGFQPNDATLRVLEADSQGGDSA